MFSGPRKSSTSIRDKELVARRIILIIKTAYVYIHVTR